MKKFIELWKKALMEPAKTFSSEKRNADLKQGAMHVGLAGIFAGLIAGIGMMFLGTALTAYTGLGSAIGIAGLITSIIVTPIMAIIGWLIGSAIYYVIAMLMGGKGDFKTQSYLIAIYTAPLAVISSIVSIIPIIGMLGIFVMLYSLYLLTLALREAHKFTTMKAVLTWLIPVILISIAVVVLGVAFLSGLGLGGLAGYGMGA